MQTVLQELISELKSIESYDLIVHGIIKRAEFKLEKEKEQIKTAFASGWNWNSDPEKYYQENYNQKEETLEEWKSKFTHHCAVKNNQKQHIIDIMKADEDDGLYDLNK
jgi:hypothetical protein